MIELKKLSKVFESASGSVEALRDVDLTINDGEIFGIIGLSGAGKSTLVRCINLLERPSSGQVIIDGRDMTSLSRPELLKMRRSISMIFQGFNLLEQRNVLKNVCFPLEISGVKRQEAEKKALELLKLVGLEEKADKYPSQLSGGQKQRVAIAGVLAMDPAILILDEATAMLDPRGRAGLMRVVRELHERGMTVVMITHFMEEAAAADRVVVLDGGEVRMDGAPEEVLVRADELRSLSLEVPFACRLSLELQAAGVPVSTCITDDTLKEELCALRSKM